MKQEDLKARLMGIRFLLLGAGELLTRAPKSDRLASLLDDVESLLADARNQVEALGREVRGC